MTGGERYAGPVNAAPRIERSEPPGPGRACPLHYRYAPESLARAPDLRADTLYIVGGLYGNRAALDALLDLASREPGPVTLVFNGDFNWFNVDAEGFAAVNETVLRHAALRGNVETEIAWEDEAAGCGCAYPAWVGDAEVARSNKIIARLRATARAFPALRARLSALPMHLVAEVCGLRTAIVHGDARSLAGWDFSQEALADPAHRARVAAQFAAANVRIFASSHTCLPVMRAFDTRTGSCVLANNGAAGMPNFRGMRQGIITRVAPDPARASLYGARLGGAFVDAVPLDYDAARFEREFLANWPAGSPAHASYHARITRGPDYGIAQAARIGNRDDTGRDGGKR